MRRAREYADGRGLVLGDVLGFGVHGTVVVAESQPGKTSRPARTAVKVHIGETGYLRERDVYLRLKQHAVVSIHECHVPQLLDFDDNLLIVEMTIVSRPFVLDFAGAFLDQAPDFSEEVMSDWLNEKYEQFGPRWPEVQLILAALKQYGIHMIDVHPNNISFDD